MVFLTHLFLCQTVQCSLSFAVYLILILASMTEATSFVAVKAKPISSIDVLSEKVKTLMETRKSKPTPRSSTVL